jgi:hypothetical protein
MSVYVLFDIAMCTTGAEIACCAVIQPTLAAKLADKLEQVFIIEPYAIFV